MKIAIAAASGNIGRRTAEKVIQAGAETILLTRQPEKLADLAAQGATVKSISSDDTQGLIEATRDAEALFWLTPPKLDVPSLHDMGAYNEWKKLFMDSDIILYLVRADRLLEKNSNTEQRANEDLGKINDWAKEFNRKRWIFIIGNVWEPHSVYSSIKNSEDYVQFLNEFDKLDSVEKMRQLARVGANEVRVVLGSIASKESANKLITAVFSQVIQNCLFIARGNWMLRQICSFSFVPFPGCLQAIP